MTNKIKSKLLLSGIVEENDYLSLYLRLITANKLNKKTPGKEKHHIIPKSFYKMFNLEIDNSKENCVYLTRIDHIKAHYYLTLCSKNEFRRNNVYAVVCLTRTSNWNDALKVLEDAHKLNNIQLLFEEHNQNVSKSRKGYKYSKEHNKKLSDSLKRTTANKGPNNSMWGVHRTSPTKNCHWYNDGMVEVMIPNDKIPAYVNLGYKKGKLTSRWWSKSKI